MADATQELMLRVRGDNSGADKAIASTKTAVEGLKVSGEKAAGAFKNFSRSLAEARDASAVAASAADSLSNIVGKSLMGAFAVGGVKLFTDQINRMGEDVKSVATSAQKAFDDIEKAGQAMSLSEATNQVAQLDALLASTSKKLSDLDRSPFQNFIAGATGARVAMEELVGTSKKLRDMKLAEGLATENANAEFTAGLDEQALQIAKVNAEYEKRSKIAQTFTDKEAYRIYQEASAAQKVRETNAVIDAMAQKAAQEKQKNTHEQIKLNQDLSQQQLKAEQELAEAQQKRFNELYDAEIKSQEQMQKRIDAELKAAQELADKKQALEENVKKAEGASPGGGGGGGGYGGGGYSGAGLTEPGLARPPGQRETAAARGAREQGERAFQKGRQQEQERYRENISQQLKDKGQASDRNAVTNEIIRRSNEEAAQRGASSEGLKQYNDAIASAKAEQKALSDSLNNSSEVTRDYGSELGKGMSELVPEFDSAQKGVDNFSEGLTENSGNMIDDFLKTGKESDELGQDFNRTGDEVEKFGEAVKKSTPPPSQDKARGAKDDGSLKSIEKLLEKNFDELKAYAHAT
jgi:hypothetical protein